MPTTTSKQTTLLSGETVARTIIDNKPVFEHDMSPRVFRSMVARGKWDEAQNRIAWQLPADAQIVAASSAEAVAVWKWAFDNFDNYKIAKGGMPLVAAPVWMGQQDTVPVGPKDDVVLTLPRNSCCQVKMTAVFDGPLAAPIEAGQVVGKLRIESARLSRKEVPLIATSNVMHLGILESILAAAEYLIGR